MQLTTTHLLLLAASILAGVDAAAAQPKLKPRSTEEEDAARRRNHFIPPPPIVHNLPKPQWIFCLTPDNEAALWVACRDSGGHDLGHDDPECCVYTEEQKKKFSDVCTTQHGAPEIEHADCK